MKTSPTLALLAIVINLRAFLALESCRVEDVSLRETCLTSILRDTRYASLNDIRTKLAFTTYWIILVITDRAISWRKYTSFTVVICCIARHALSFIEIVLL